MHYQKKLDEIFANGNTWQHRTFRTVLDPYSYEYGGTSKEQKVEYVKKCISNGLALDELIDGYKVFYKEEKKAHVLDSLEDGLIRLTTTVLSRNE